MSKVIFLHGLPGSGKSTFSNEYIKAHPEEEIVRINRDDIRTQLFGKDYHKRDPDKHSEKQVTIVEKQLFKDSLKKGKTIIDDNTNLNPRFIRSAVITAKEHGAIIEQEHFNIPIDECKRRNRKRGAEGGRLVPEKVIDRMAASSYDDEGNLKEFVITEKGNVFAVPRNTPGQKIIDSFNKKANFDNPLIDGAIVFVDVDGTLANNQHFASYYLNREGTKKKDFRGFYKSIKNSPVNENVRDLANKMRDEEGLGIVVLTGRDDSYAKELVDFVKDSGIKVSRLICKRAGDFRPDSEFKAEVIEKLKKEGLNPVHAIDDRESSIKTMEDAGLIVSKVDVPSFKFKEGDPVPTIPAEEPKVNTIYDSGSCIRCGKSLRKGNIGPKCKLK